MQKTYFKISAGCLAISNSSGRHLQYILINKYTLQIVKEYFFKWKFHGTCNLFYWKSSIRLLLYIVQWNFRSPIVQFSNHRDFDSSRCICGIKEGLGNDGLVWANRCWDGYSIWCTIWAGNIWIIWLQLHLDWYGILVWSFRKGK